MASQPPPPLMEATRSVIESFGALLSDLEHADEKFRKQLSPLALKNQYDRFRLWAANLGALHHGRASLDFRLMDSSAMQTTLLKLMSELRLVISKNCFIPPCLHHSLESHVLFAGNEIVLGSRLPLEEALTLDSGEALEDFSDSDSSGGENGDHLFSSRTELGQNATETNHIISSLMKVSFKIRQPVSRTTQLRHKALSHKLSIRIDDTSTGDLFTAYSEFDRLHVEEMFRKFRKHTIEMDPKSAFRVKQRLGESRQYHDKLDRQLIDRWSKSITDRRRFFSYWKRHASKLSRAKPLEKEVVEWIPPRPSILATQQLDVQQPVEVQGSASHVQRMESALGLTLLSETDATKFEDHPDNTDTVSTVSYASTALDVGEHLGRSMSLKPTAAFGVDIHGDLGEAQIQSISALSVASRVDERKACPFCLSFGPFKKDLLNHMAFHMEELATFAISRSAGEESDRISLGTNSGATIGDRSAISLISASQDFSHEDLANSHPSGRAELSEHTRSDGVQSPNFLRVSVREPEPDTWGLNRLELDDHEAIKNVFFGQWHFGTLSWFLASADFELWSSEKGRLLFIHGFPGVGKSVLASVIANTLDKALEVGVATLFCDSQPQEITEESLLLSLLRQLMRSMSIRSDKNFSLRHQRQNPPNQQELLETLEEVVAEFERVHIIIDGFDQLKDYIRVSLLRLLKKLNDQKVSILITSRTIPLIMRDMEGWPTVFFDSKADDIRLWLRERNPHSQSTTPSDLLEDVDDQVVQFSEGIFLFATFKLQSQSIADMTRERSYADPFDNFYARQIERIVHSQHPELAAKLLAWAARSTTAMTTIEAQAMFAFMDIIWPANTSPRPSLDSIISSCAGLLVVDEKDRIQFSHSTGLKYFSENQATWFLNAANEQAELCCRYISLDAFESGACSTLIDYKARLWSHPFFRYAALHWGRNTFTAFTRMKDPRRVKASVIYKIVMRFLGSEAKSQAAYQALTANDESLGEPPPERWTNLYLAVLFSLQQILAEILSEVANDHDFFRDGPKVRLLFLASMGGNTVILEQLLEFMATNIPRTLERNLSPGDIAVELKLGLILRTAVEDRQLHVVEVLLKFHANEDIRDSQGYLLRLAVENLDHGIVFALLKAGVSPNAADFLQQTPLAMAIAQGHADIVRLLLSQGADPNIPSGSDETPLSVAVMSAKRSIIGMLFGYGANPNARTPMGVTPLELAITIRDAKTTRLLLGYGADANAQSLGGTPLVLAARGEGLEEIVENLLHRGADPDLPDSSGKRALEIAWSSGNKATELILTKFKESAAVKTDDPANGVFSAASNNLEDHLLHLLVKGGNANQENPLYVASGKGFSGVVDALLLYGADPNAAGSGGTPLVMAAKNGHLAVVHTLITWGARLEEADVNGMSALSHAAQRGHLSIVMVLFQSGAREDKRDLHGNLPADLALQSGHFSTRRFLLEVSYLQVSRPERFPES
ncbi:hypothetical protein CSIM01_04730 [Colletotrichum simmondsii]|uniref:AAA+ ATPase domain-containing protein n=1 Tax=Colletotrichum simmondsii TaxID=703756 RepID=A0A135TUB1_9PEZI|nr:hypothetical protein CSIM01_04730 [Colletotrichum simmondsii]